MKKKSSTYRSYIFFDLDRTLLAHDSMFLFCNYILRQNPLRRLFLLLFLPALLLFTLRLLSPIQLKRVFFSFLFYMRMPALDYYAENFVQTALKPLFFPEILALIQKHREAGDFLILNTASIEPYVKYIAKELGFDVYYASKMELRDPMPLIPKIFKNNIGYAKIESMEELLPMEVISHYQKLSKKKYKNSKVPILRGACIYTDSLADLPLINLAENVLIVQPSQRKLREMARERDWPLIEPKERITKKAGSWNDISRRFFIILMQMSGLYRLASSSKV